MPSDGRLQGLPPVLAADARVLVLGSFPGAASLQAQQYYAHPRNQFWPLLGALWGQDLHRWPYAQRLSELQRRGVGLWDVYASCLRQGSLDTAIREPAFNDFASLRQRAPGLRAVLHNGAESARAARHLTALGYTLQRLPSTSPAHARWSFEQKLQAWRDALAAAFS